MTLKLWLGQRALAIGAVTAMSVFLFAPIDDLTPKEQLAFSIACGVALTGLAFYVSQGE